MDKYEILKQYFGYDNFRDGQELLIDSIMAGHDVLGVMPTGTGKSICYQIPALLFPGITIVVSPLLALMKDQVDSLAKKDFPAAFIDRSLSPSQYDKALKNVSMGLYKILYVAPERLLTKSFLSFVKTVPVSMLAVDEAHCISQWGDGYRPSYSKIAGFIHQLPARPVVCAFTATATKRVREDIQHGLQLETPVVRIMGYDRENLRFFVQKPKDKTLALLKFLQQRKEQCGIVYCSTKKAVDDVCGMLKKNGYNAQRYHAGLTDEERKENQAAFLSNRVPIMVATDDFGWGIDKGDVSFTVHYNMPKDMESYYQEAGRAGRNGQSADCLLLYNPKDILAQEYIINNPDPKEELDAKTKESVQLRERDKLKDITSYCNMKGCLRQYILRYFGEAASPNCGNCGNCLSKQSSEQISQPVKAQTIDTDQTKTATAAAMPDLMARLRKLRSSIAKRQGVPPLIIFSDDSLADMCKRLPHSDKEFLLVAGVEEFRRKHYGQAFLKEISVFVQEQKAKRA